MTIEDRNHRNHLSKERDVNIVHTCFSLFYVGIYPNFGQKAKIAFEKKEPGPKQFQQGISPLLSIYHSDAQWLRHFDPLARSSKKVMIDVMWQ